MTIPTFSILSAGLVVLDIVLVNGEKKPLYQAGGTCCNVSSMLAYMGGYVSITGRLGADDASIAVTNDLHLHNVNTKGIINDLKETPSIIEKVNPTTALHSFSLRCTGCSRHLSSYRSITLDHARKLISEDFTKVDLFFFDRVTPGNLLLAEEARRNGALIFFEPPRMEIGSDFYKAIKLCHIVKYASSTLGKIFADGIPYPDNFEEIPLLEIETLGSAGLKFRQKHRKWTMLEPHGESLNIVDTAGAGDWLSASFIYSLLTSPNAMKNLIESKTVTKYLRSAQQVASYNCQFIGARGAMDHTEFSSVLDQIRDRKSTTDFPRRSSIIDSVVHTESCCSICLQNSNI